MIMLLSSEIIKREKIITRTVNQQNTKENQ